MLRCYIYIRVSTEEQAREGFSIDNQKRACKDYAEMNNYHISRIFVDDGKSARTTDRAAFQELLMTVKDKPVDAIIIYKIDRFARNVGDFSNLRKQFKELGVKLLSVSENGDVTEGLVGNIFASVAEWESEVNGQRTRDALMQKYRDGWQPTPPPIGYVSIGGEREKKSCKPDTYIAPIIKELFELYATGNYSILELQDWLEDKDILTKKGTSLSHGVIHNIIRNPFYYGLIRWKGQSKIGKHQPIISKELFDTCQYVLAKHRNFLTRRRQHDFLLRGFAYCKECGQRYTAEWHKDSIKLKKLGGKIAYYHCQKRNRNGCRSPYVEVNDLEKIVTEEFKKVQFSEEFIQAVVTKTKEKLNNYRKDYQKRLKTILNRKSSSELKRDKLEDALLDGIIDRETFKRKHFQIQQSLSNLEEEIIEMENKRKIDIDLIEEVLSFSRNIYLTYVEAPPFLKRHYLRFFYEKVYVKDKYITEVKYTPIFQTLIDAQQVILRNEMLPIQEIDISFDFASIYEAFQDLSCIGQLRQRWNEIKKLQYNV